MPTQPSILAAVDLDRHATHVISQASRLAALCHGHLVVAHVVDDADLFVPDQPFLQRPADARDAMARHARASLVGMVSHLDLPNAWVEIRVEVGSITRTLADIATAIQPRYCLLGPARHGPLSPSAGLVAAIGPRGDCELLTVPMRQRADDAGIIPRTRHWRAPGYLKRSKGLLGSFEQVHAVARRGFYQDDVEAAAYFSRMQMPIGDLQKAMYDAQETAYDEAVDRYIESNPERIDHWATGER